ncbi:MarR family transcriptional regulator [Streptomyces sp. NPDC058864]
MTDRDPANTERQPPPAVVSSLALLHGELRARHRLSFHDYLVLGALAGAGERTMPVIRLTALLREPGTRTTAVLKGLEAAGLIERHRRDRDRRRVEVTLTEAGRARFADAERTAQERLRGHLLP